MPNSVFPATASRILGTQVHAPTGLAFPTRVYAPTRLGGVYYTDSFTTPDDATQPVWTTVNGGLNVLTIKCLDVDPSDRAGRQVCLTTTENNIYYRPGTGNWVTVLTLGQFRTAVGQPTALLAWATFDRAGSGRIWVFGYLPNLALSPVLYIGYSDNSGVSWTWLTSSVGTFAIRAGGNLIATGMRLWRTYNDSSAGAGRISTSSDGGVNWTPSTTLGISNWIPYAHVNSLDGQAYVDGNGTNGPDLLEVSNALALTVLLDSVNIGPSFPQSMWFSKNNVNYQRVVKGNKTYTTTDGWATLVDPAPVAATENIDYILAPHATNENLLVYGSYSLAVGQNHLVWTRVGDTGALLGKSGSDPAGGVNSIPTVAVGISVSGLAFVG